MAGKIILAKNKGPIKLIRQIIDFFYPPFRKFLSVQNFRYLVLGLTNTFIGLLAYYITFKFLIKEKEVSLGLFAFKPHTFALFVSFCITFIIGFLSAKFIVFSESNMRSRIQLIRYFLVCLFNLFLNYILLKIGVEVLHIYPTIAQLVTTILVVSFSYLAQRHFSFKVQPLPDND